MKPLIVAFVADLMFQTRIESVSGKLGFRIRLVESQDQIVQPEIETIGNMGPEGILIDQVARLGPALLIFDLGNASIPWRQWIPVIKMVPATRRIAVLCFGSHVDVDTLKAARQAGTDEVVARSRFVSALPELIQKYARRTEPEVLTVTCAQPLPPDAVKGLELFNQGDYFSAHEWLEEAWKADLSPGRDLYRGVLQIAVAYFHLRRGNYRGAVKMFQRARYWLDPLPDVCREVAIAEFRQAAYGVHDQVLTLGPERIDEFDISMLSPIQWSGMDVEI